MKKSTKILATTAVSAVMLSGCFGKDKVDVSDVYESTAGIPATETTVEELMGEVAPANIDDESVEDDFVRVDPVRPERSEITAE